MADTEKKYIIQQKTESGMITLHPETIAEVVKLDNTAAGMSATNVQEAFKEVMDTIEGVTGGGVVTGVKGENETEYRKGQVNITKGNIGLGNVDNTSDLNKPISTATQSALDLKADKTQLSSYIPTSQKGAASGVATLDSNTKIPVSQIPDLSSTYILASQKGANSGVATLGSDGKIPSSQLPSYVDDVIDGTFSTFPTTGEDGKIYVDTTTNKTYRWSGSQYVEISASLALGETSSTAYAGDKGKKNADDIAAIIAGTQAVGKATNADNATHATSADSATTATNAGNVTTTLNGKNITDIFETDGITAKKATISTTADEATHAASADSATTATNADTAETATKLSTPRAISLTGDVTGTANFDGSAPASISTTLKNSGVTAGAYSVVNVNAKGIVTQGGQIIQIGTTGQESPTSDLAVGGIFFKEI